MRPGPGRSRACLGPRPGHRPRGLAAARLGARSLHHEEATIDADDRTLTFEFIGGHERSYKYSGARVLESGNAVALIPNLTECPTGSQTLAGHRRQVTATLSRPLGHRVLLDTSGEDRSK